MSRYIMIRRLRWPAILMLVGVVALLHELGVVDHFWHMFVPLLLILLGTLLLAERAALAVEGYPPYSGFPPYPGAMDPSMNPGGYPGANPMTGVPQPPPQPGTAIVPVHDNDFENDRGQL